MSFGNGRVINGKAALARRSAQYQLVVLEWNILHSVLVQDKLKAAVGFWQLLGGRQYGLLAPRSNSLCQNGPASVCSVAWVLDFRRFKQKCICLIQAKADAVPGMQQCGLNTVTIYVSSVRRTVLEAEFAGGRSQNGGVETGHLGIF